ncbi:Hypothetical predicted protein, partial [Marmota monax]
MAARSRKRDRLDYKGQREERSRGTGRPSPRETPKTRTNFPVTRQRISPPLRSAAPPHPPRRAARRR